MLDDKGSSPLYLRLQAILRQEIVTGRLVPGGRIPTESELMARFGVSRTTVRQALADLVYAGLVVRRQGKGSFVAQPRIERSAGPLTGFAEEVAKLGLPLKTVLVEARYTLPTPEQTQALRLSSSERVFYLERVRCVGGQPVVLEKSWFPEATGEWLLREDLSRVAIYEVFERKYGLSLVRAVERVTASAASARDAELLKTDQGAPVLQAERTTFTEDDCVVELATHLYRPDAFCYRIELTREAVLGASTALGSKRARGASTATADL